MLHTIYITHRITSYKQYNKLYEILNNNSNNAGYKFYPSKDNNAKNTIYTTNYLKDIGFNAIVLRKKINKEKYRNRPWMQVEILLNPKKLIDTNKTKITKDKDIVPISNRFNEVIKGLDDSLKDFYYWTLKRIDYATYIKTPYVKEYIELFQHGDVPSKHFEELYKDGGHRKGQRKGSFYLYSNSVAINFYDKEQERRDNKEKYNIPEEDIIKAKDILRIEVQLNKTKTDYIKRSYKFETKELHNFLDLDTSRQEILKYYKKCIRVGDYYTLKKARKLIDNSDLSPKAKTPLKDTVKLINKCRSIAEARKEFNGVKDTFNAHLRELDKLGINPVTIPERCNVKELINPIKEIEINMQNYGEE